GAMLLKSPPLRFRHPRTRAGCFAAEDPFSAPISARTRLSVSNWYNLCGYVYQLPPAAMGTPLYFSDDVGARHGIYPPLVCRDPGKANSGRPFLWKHCSALHHALDRFRDYTDLRIWGTGRSR